MRQAFAKYRNGALPEHPFSYYVSQIKNMIAILDAEGDVQLPPLEGAPDTAQARLEYFVEVAQDEYYVTIAELEEAIK